MSDGAETVRLTVPAMTDYVRIARLASSGVAERAGFDFEDVDDLRIAVDELCHAAIDAMHGGTVEVVFELDGDSVSVEVRASPTPPRGDDSRSPFPLSPLTEQILAAIVDEWSTGSDAGTCWYRFLVRRGSG